MTLILLAALFIRNVNHVDGLASCTTPSGGVGTCKSIYQCDALLHLVNKNDRTPDDIHVLHKSQCGPQGTTPSLCCPETCYTPDNLPGTCVSIFMCPHLLNLLRLPVSQETMQYLQYSRCLDSKRFSVCCDPRPVLNLGPITTSPAPNGPMTSFALSTHPPNGPSPILNPGTPSAEPATYRPVTAFTLPPNRPEQIPSTEAPTTTNLAMPPSTIASNPSTDASSVKNRVMDEMIKTEVVELPCLTPSGESGTCKSIKLCGALLGLVTKTNRTLQETDLLKRSQCGFHEGNPTVCCSVGSDLCFTPDGQPGKCINVNFCPHLRKMLTSSASTESIKYIRNSRCDSSDMYSVCCGPPPNLSPPPKGNCAATVSAFPPDPRTECCGVDGWTEERPVSPGVTFIDQYPWLALIEYLKNETLKQACVGTLISAKYVVTAGHCLTGPSKNIGTPTNVRLGEYNTTNEGPDCVLVDTHAKTCTDGAIVIPIEEIILHPEYIPNRKNFRNDIGLIRMQAMAPYSDFIRPICLPQEDITMFPPSNLIFYVAGWGYVSSRNPKSQLKLHVDLPYVSLETCQSQYTERRRVSLWYKHVCAGGVRGKDACKGDSGSPLMYKNGRTFEIIGITSFGTAPCGIGVPGVFTKVYEYITWIRRTVRP